MIVWNRNYLSTIGESSRSLSGESINLIAWISKYIIYEVYIYEVFSILIEQPNFVHQTFIYVFYFFPHLVLHWKNALHMLRCLQGSMDTPKFPLKK